MSQPDLSNAVNYHYGQFPPKTLDYERLIDPLVKTAGSLARYDQTLEAMHNSEILLAPLRQQEAVVSSRMEGTISTLDEILQIEADAQSGDDDVLYSARSEAVETLLYARAMQRIQREMEDGRSISNWLVRTAHQMLLSHGRGANKDPGAYKTEQNYIGEKRRKSISFIPISPEQLTSGMDQLFEFANSNPLTPLLKIAISHVEFEALHPFKDGNGRVGRMLITLMLWDYKLIKAPHFYVSAFFEDARDEYIDLMRAVSANGDWTEWCLCVQRIQKKQAPFGPVP
ncbi:MAG: Fic family protein, partial [Marinosulfonomonas sp.]|nr:Fic family protein [Marinosulfonomonas sp.]